MDQLAKSLKRAEELTGGEFSEQKLKEIQSILDMTISEIAPDQEGCSMVGIEAMDLLMWSDFQIRRMVDDWHPMGDGWEIGSAGAARDRS